MKRKKMMKSLLESSKYNPYIGKLSREDNLICAIQIAKLLKDFADNGNTDESMNISSEQYSLVISELESTLSDIKMDEVLGKIIYIIKNNIWLRSNPNPMASNDMEVDPFSINYTAKEIVDMLKNQRYKLY